MSKSCEKRHKVAPRYGIHYRTTVPVIMKPCSIDFKTAPHTYTHLYRAQSFTAYRGFILPRGTPVRDPQTTHFHRYLVLLPKLRSSKRLGATHEAGPDRLGAGPSNFSRQDARAPCTANCSVRPLPSVLFSFSEAAVFQEAKGWPVIHLKSVEFSGTGRSDSMSRLLHVRAWIGLPH